MKTTEQLADEIVELIKDLPLKQCIKILNLSAEKLEYLNIESIEVEHEIIKSE